MGDERDRHPQHARAPATARLQADLRQFVGDLRRRHEEILHEDIPLQQSIIQHNDYATTKWVNEIQIMNFEKRYGSPIVRLRFFNAYGPGEYYHNYRSVVCLFCYRALHDLPYTVYRGYYRVFMYIDDFIPTLANVCENFRPGEVYNIGGTEFCQRRGHEQLLLEYIGKGDELVDRTCPRTRTTSQNKRPDMSRAARDVRPRSQVSAEEGIPKTVEWMRAVYVDDRMARRHPDRPP